MRQTTPFDTHSHVKRLVAAGVPEAQAEIHAEVFADVIIERLATKDDLLALEQRMDAKLESLEQRLRAEMKDMELRLTLRLGGMIAVGVAIVVAAIKLL